MRSVEVMVGAVPAGKPPSVLQAAGLEVTTIKDVTPSHNGAARRSGAGCKIWRCK